VSIRDERREAAIELMADHILRQGMGAASLRPLAAAAGTSDRMLLYYFADRDELISATLERVAARLTTMLDTAVPADLRLPFGELLLAVWSAVRSAEMKPYMRVWLELAASAARDLEPHRTIANGIMNAFVRWTGDHLAVGRASEREQLSALLLATVEGALFLEAIGRRDLADTAVAEAGKRDGSSVPTRAR
jgi:AcrR family transcriptional regulator